MLCWLCLKMIKTWYDVKNMKPIFIQTKVLNHTELESSCYTCVGQFTLSVHCNFCMGNNSGDDGLLQWMAIAWLQSSASLNAWACFCEDCLWSTPGSFNGEEEVGRFGTPALNPSKSSPQSEVMGFSTEVTAFNFSRYCTSTCPPTMFIILHFVRQAMQYKSGHCWPWLPSVGMSELFY